MPGNHASADLGPPQPGLTVRHPAAARGLLLALVLAMPGLVVAATSCQAHSGAARVTVVELYTSEGCSSCPPADRWFSSLKSSSDEASSGSAAANPLLPLAFHVTYWDRLGWADRFARPAYTERQNQLAAAAGARVVYTPQVIVDGADWRGWPRLPKPASAPEVELRLRRDGETFHVDVKRRDGVTPTAGSSPATGRCSRTGIAPRCGPEKMPAPACATTTWFAPTSLFPAGMPNASSIGLGRRPSPRKARTPRSPSGAWPSSSSMRARSSRCRPWPCHAERQAGRRTFTRRAIDSVRHC